MNKASFLARCAAIMAAVIFIGCAGGPEEPAMTARFDTFFRDILAGHVPTANLTPAMKQGLTPQLVSQLDEYYASCGKYQKLQYLGKDTVQGYDRYHYAAIFDKGKQGLMFVLDSSGDLAGFFKDQ